MDHDEIEDAGPETPEILLHGLRGGTGNVRRTRRRCSPHDDGWYVFKRITTLIIYFLSPGIMGNKEDEDYGNKEDEDYGNKEDEEWGDKETTMAA